MIIRISFLWKMFCRLKNISRVILNVWKECQNRSWHILAYLKISSFASWVQLTGKKKNSSCSLPWHIQCQGFEESAPTVLVSCLLKGRAWLHTDWAWLVKCDVTCQISWYMERLNNPASHFKAWSRTSKEFGRLCQITMKMQVFIVNHRFFI